MKKFDFVLILIILLSFATTFYFYSMLPDKIITHWNASGQADGFSSKSFWNVFLLPIFSVVFLAFYFLLPGLDPLKDNYKKFESYYSLFFLVLLLFFYYIHLLTLFVNLGYSFNLIYYLIPGVAILIYFSGVLVENSKRNYFVGVRTPWALHSDVIWDKTNKRAGFLLKISSLICLIGLFFDNIFSLLLLLIPLFFALGYSVLYSYLEFRKLKK